MNHHRSQRHVFAAIGARPAIDPKAVPQEPDLPVEHLKACGPHLGQNVFRTADVARCHTVLIKNASPRQASFMTTTPLPLRTGSSRQGEASSREHVHA